MPAQIPMTEKQRISLLALPETEEAVVRHHSFDAADLAATAQARTPETRLGHALQLCCLRFPGRHMRKGEFLPAVMLDHIAEQIGVDADVIAQFARRAQTRYEQLAALKRHYGYCDLSRSKRVEPRPVGMLEPEWLAGHPRFAECDEIASVIRRTLDPRRNLGQCRGSVKPDGRDLRYCDFQPVNDRFAPGHQPLRPRAVTGQKSTTAGPSQTA